MRLTLPPLVALGTATASGVTSFQDADPNQVPVTAISDDFLAANIGSNPLGVSTGAGQNTFLFQQSFNMVGQNGYNTAVDFTYNFTAAQLSVLANYIMNGGGIAFGIDPDCHFWNNGIVFNYTTAVATPEPATMALLGSGLAGVGYFQRRRRQRTLKAVDQTVV